MHTNGHTPGPYWLNQTDTEFLVCGAHGKVMFRYASNQEALAIAHVKRLQKGRADLAERQAGNSELAESNARLIADLLAALILVRDNNRKGVTGAKAREAWAVANAAIARAESRLRLPQI